MSEEKGNKSLAETLVDLFIETALDDGSGSTLNDAWTYWEEEWQDDLRSTLLDSTEELLAQYQEETGERLDKPWESDEASDWLVRRIMKDPQDEDYTIFDVVHRTFWEKHGHVDDRVIRDYIVADIPEFKPEEIMESCFVFEGSVEEVKAYVESLGMTIMQEDSNG